MKKLLVVFFGIILLSQSFTMSYGQWTDYNEHDPGISQNVMPDWFKNNAKWWKDGLISDADMINALESLMIQDIIPLDKFVKSTPGMQHEAGVQKGGTFSIPSYQKDVFGFWSDGIVSDGEIVNSIGHLMGQGIINSEKIQEKRASFSESSGLEFESSAIEYRSGTEDTTVIKQPGLYKFTDITLKRGDFENIFVTTKQNEVSMTYLQKIKTAEYDLAIENCEHAQNAYSENKDQTLMNKMVDACKTEKDLQEQSQKSLEILKKSVELVNDAKDVAMKSGLNILDLENLVREQQSEIDSITNIETPYEIKSAYSDAINSQKKSNTKLQKTILEKVEHHPNYDQLSITDKNFVTAVIGDIEYSDFKIDEMEQSWGTYEYDIDIEMPTMPNADKILPDSVHIKWASEGIAEIMFLIDIATPKDAVKEFTNPDWEHHENESSPDDSTHEDLPSSPDDSTPNDEFCLGCENEEMFPDEECEYLHEQCESVIPQLRASIVGAGFDLHPKILDGYRMINDDSAIEQAESEANEQLDWEANFEDAMDSLIDSAIEQAESEANEQLDWEANFEDAMDSLIDSAIEQAESEANEQLDWDNFENTLDSLIDSAITETCTVCGENQEDKNMDGKCDDCNTDITANLDEFACDICDEQLEDKDLDRHCDACGSDIECPDCGLAVDVEDGSCLGCGEDVSSTVDNPDGSVTTYYPDKTTATTYPDGKHVTTFSDGTTIISYPDGTSTKLYSDGTTINFDEDGNEITETNSNEKTRTTNSDGTTTIIYPDGTNVWLTNGGTKATITYTDGTVERTSHSTNFVTGAIQVKIGTTLWNFDTPSEAYAAVEGLVDEYLSGSYEISGPYDPDLLYTLPVVTADYGREYPAYQLKIFKYHNACDGQKHYISNTATFFATTLSLGGHLPVGNCGFGTVSDYPIQNISVEGNILNEYLNYMGLDSFPPVPEDTSDSYDYSEDESSDYYEDPEPSTSYSVN